MRPDFADTVQTGVYGITIAAVDIAAPAVLPSESRPLKRRFTEIEDTDDEGPDSDELYGWVDDDEVAAEGLLIEEPTAMHDLDTAAAEEVAGQQQDRVTSTQRESVSPDPIAPI